MIEIKNTSIVIHDYELGDCPKLEKSLSYWNSVTFTVDYCFFMYNEEQKKLVIPGGYDISYLSYLFPDKEIVYSKEKVPTMFLSYKMNSEPRDELQRDCIDFALGEGKFYKTRNDSQKMICMDTGKGKSYSMVNIISKIKKKAIIFMDQQTLIDQWKDENFLKFTNLKEKDIYVIAGASSMNKIMKKDTDTPYKIFLASYKTIASFANKYGWEALGDFFNKIKVGVKVYDEAHTDIRNIFNIDMVTNVPLNYYLTATPGRSDHKEDVIYKRAFKTVPVFGKSEQKNKDERYHNVVFINYDSNPSANDEVACVTKYGFSINDFFKYTFEKDDKTIKFLTVIKKVLNLVINNKGKIAILVHNIEHVELMRDFLSELYPDVEIGLYYSKISKEEKEDTKKNKKIIITTDKSMGKAIDIADLRYLISTIPTSSEIVLQQMMGRLRRLPDKEVVYFDVTDVGFSACVQQQKKRQRFLKHKAKSIKVLKM